jgi:hypothetical protein
MNDRTLIILGVVGLAGYYLFKRDLNQPAAPVATQPLYQPNYGYMAGAPTGYNTPRDPGDVNNWLPGVITAGAGLATSIINATASDSGTYSYGGSDTPEGWVEPSW